jgi:hypothetical protein
VEDPSTEPLVVETDPASEAPQLLGKPAQGDGSCRGGYGLAVMSRYGTTCAYCDRDLGESYEAWLDLSVDHVVPRNALAVGVSGDWIEDLLNHVTCCRACNEFLNGLRVTVTAPTDLAGFLRLRDAILAQKRERARQRHALERAKFGLWREALDAS